MPTYVIACDKCQTEFEILCKIDEREQFDDGPCGVCADGKLYRKIQSPAFGDPVKMGFQKPDQGFKEVLQRIDSLTPGSQLKENSHIVKL